MGVIDDVKRDYPDLWFLFGNPEIGPLLRDAVDPNKGFGPEEFKAKLFATHWYRQRSQSMRNWEILQHTDPGEANQRRRSYRINLQTIGSKLGIPLSHAELGFLTEVGLQRSQDPNSPEVLFGLMQMAQKMGSKVGPGAIRTAAHDARDLARGQYFQSMDRAHMYHWGRAIVGGTKSINDLNEELQKQAMARYPYLKEQLMGGQTLAQVVQPLREIVANELELGSGNNVDVMNNPNWRKLLSYHDASTGKVRLMTDSEALTLARSDPRYWKTAKGTQQDAGMVNFLFNTFGERKAS